MTFEDYLDAQFMKEYHGDKDHFEDAFNNWLNDLQIDDWFKYEKEYHLSSGLKSMDKNEIYHLLSDYAVLPHAINIPEQRMELSKFICSHFGTPQIPTVEWITKAAIILQQEMKKSDVLPKGEGDTISLKSCERIVAALHARLEGK